MIVIDTSVVIAALAGHEASRRVMTDQRLVAPRHIDVEVAHAVRGLLRVGKLGEDAAQSVLSAWCRLAIDRVGIAPLLPRVWELKENLTSSDAAFVATAEAHGIPLLTADRRLATAAGPRCAIHLVPA